MRFVNLWRFADEQLAKTQYLAGEEITAADLAVYPIYLGRADWFAAWRQKGVKLAPDGAMVHRVEREKVTTRV